MKELADRLVNNQWFKSGLSLLYAVVMFMIVGQIAVMHQQLIEHLDTDMRQALSFTFILAAVAGIAINQGYEQLLELLREMLGTNEKEEPAAQIGKEA